MKKILLILIMICGSSFMYCQSLKPDVITTAGSFNINANNSVSWTIGECLIETFSNTNNKLTQGFQQSIYEINTAIDNTLNLIKINLFPNPATDYINLEIELQDNQEFSYELYDLNGKCLQNGKINSAKSEIKLAGYSSRTYVLNVYARDRKILKSFKILKIN
jgi:hypothetical protein